MHKNNNKKNNITKFLKLKMKQNHKIKEYFVVDITAITQHHVMYFEYYIF